jgi:hypothetical protein
LQPEVSETTGKVIRPNKMAKISDSNQNISDRKSIANLCIGEIDQPNEFWPKVQEKMNTYKSGKNSSNLL